MYVAWHRGREFREHGVHGTAFADVLKHARAPRGSVYHHFPRGKQQLAEEATRYAGDFIAAGLTAALADDDPPAALHAFVTTWIEIVRDSDFSAGCPVLAASLEGVRAPGASAAAAEAFGRWEQELATAIARRGIPDARARSLATLAIAAIEGGIVLARAHRSSAPLERVGEELKRLMVAVVDDADDRVRR